mmetsp:Transcript_49370/g.159356  ORF Transcript_49370/g.159356 Transcript_49370/m.159356 type:complete len:340 (+) Transcript_49370:40-1059(+)
MPPALAVGGELPTAICVSSDDDDVEEVGGAPVGAGCRRVRRGASRPRLRGLGRGGRGGSASGATLASSRSPRRGVEDREQARSEVNSLGMPARMAYYYVCFRRDCTGARCIACRELLSSAAVSSDTPTRGLALGFKRPWLREPCWIHAASRCMELATLPALPRGRVLFSPAVGARDRNIVFRAFQARSLAPCTSAGAAAMAALARVAPWRYTPAVVQYWANDGQPYGSLGLHSGFSSSGGLDLRFGSREDELEDEEEGLGGGLSAAAVARLAPARPLAAHEACEETLCCAICHESLLAGQVVRRLPCEHLFHDVCILPWLRRRAVCPLDRIALQDTPPL